MLRKTIIIILSILPVTNVIASGLDLRLGDEAAEIVADALEQAANIAQSLPAKAG